MEFTTNRFYYTITLLFFSYVYITVHLIEQGILVLQVLNLIMLADYNSITLRNYN